MKRVLVTGASGFVGRHSVPHLLEAGYEVHAVSQSNIQIPEVEWHRADLLDHRSRQILLQKVRPECLLHFAWYVPPGKYWTSLENVRWLNASLDLVRELAECGGRRFVGAGTCAEYSWNPGGICEEDRTPLTPASLYGASKNALGSMLPHLAAELGIESAWGRIFFPFGPNEPMARLVPSIIASIRKGEPARCTEGLPIRDFIYVDDVARAFVTLLSSDYQGSVNIGTGEGVSIASLAQTIANLLSRPDLLQLGALPTRTGEPDILVASIEKLRSTGFTPHWSLENALKATAGL